MEISRSYVASRRHELRMYKMLNKMLSSDCKYELVAFRFYRSEISFDPIPTKSLRGNRLRLESFSFYMAPNVRRRVCMSTCIFKYTNAKSAVRTAAPGWKESEKKKHRPDKDLIVMAPVWRSLYSRSASRREGRSSQPHRANCNSVETIGASGSSVGEECATQLLGPG